MTWAKLGWTPEPSTNCNLWLLQEYIWHMNLLFFFYYFLFATFWFLFVVWPIMFELSLFATVCMERNIFAEMQLQNPLAIVRRLFRFFLLLLESYADICLWKLAEKSLFDV